MKQVIVLISSVLLGIFIFTKLMGSGGLFGNMQLLWENERSIRNMQVVSP